MMNVSTADEPTREQRAGSSADALTNLRTAASSYARAEAHRRMAMDRLRDAMAVADRLGHSRAKIVKVSGLARQTVYDALDRRRV